MKRNPINSSFVATLLFILILLPPPSSPSPYSDRRRLSLSSRQIVNCSSMASRSQCSQNPKCRWCRSEALDDTCFTKIDAWRLPQQVFVCD
ncbi:hypothetical protein LINGRAHAP2_LOCUS5680 [Linum grandiflorum]